jgi:hypothetical protein
MLYYKHTCSFAKPNKKRAKFTFLYLMLGQKLTSHFRKIGAGSVGVRKSIIILMLILYHPFTRNPDEWVLFQSQPLEYPGTEKNSAMISQRKDGSHEPGFRHNIIYSCI